MGKNSTESHYKVRTSIKPSNQSTQISIIIYLLNLYLYHQNLLHSTDAPLPEYKTQALKKSRFILSHYGMFKGCWDWLILVATFYVAVAVPYNAAFVRTNRLTMPSDVMVEALFIVGNVPNFDIIYFLFPFFSVDTHTHMMTQTGMLKNLAWKVKEKERET